MTGPGLVRERYAAGVLLVGAVLVLVLVEAAGLRFFHVPLLLGLVLAAAALAGRSHGPLWAPACVLVLVGATDVLWFRSGRPADSLVLAQLTLVAAGTGALLAAALRPLGVVVAPAGLALAVLLTGAFALAQAAEVPGVVGNAWLYAGLLALWAAALLLRPGPARVSSSASAP